MISKRKNRSQSFDPQDLKGPLKPRTQVALHNKSAMSMVHW